MTEREQAFEEVLELLSKEYTNYSIQDNVKAAAIAQYLVKLKNKVEKLK